MNRRYTEQRGQYDNFGRGFDNYERYSEETLNKKMKGYRQKDKVTQ